MLCSDFAGLLLGVLVDLVLGGVFASTFSWVLLAELAVGRIILAKKLSSTGFVPTLLVRDFGLSLPGDASEARDGCRGTFEAGTRGDAPVASFFRVEGFRVRPDEGV